MYMVDGIDYTSSQHPAPQLCNNQCHLKEVILVKPAFL